jgi:hypothetical protein
MFLVTELNHSGYAVSDMPISYELPYNMFQTVRVSFIPCSEIGFYVNYTILKEEMLG